MTTTELLQVSRDELDDNSGADSVRFWRDSELMGYLREAQNDFCKQTLCLVSSIDDALCLIPLVSGKRDYPYSSRILRIDSVQPSWFNNPLVDARGFSRLSPQWRSRIGRPNSWCADYESGYISLDGALTATNGESLRLTVRRLPVMLTLLQNPEIREEYQQILRLYVNYRAYAKQDSEVYNPQKSLTEKKRWDEAVERAKGELARLQPRIIVARSCDI